MRDERISKLPKWAQRYISELEQDNETYKAKLSAGPEDSDTFADPYDTERPLGRGTRIRFGRSREGFTVYLDKDGELQVSSNWASVHIKPRAANALSVRMER